MKHLIVKFPAYHVVLENYCFNEITGLREGVFHVGGKSGPTGWV